MLEMNLKLVVRGPLANARGPPTCRPFPFASTNRQRVPGTNTSNSNQSFNESHSWNVRGPLNQTRGPPSIIDYV